jgi:hypothetical protein
MDNSNGRIIYGHDDLDVVADKATAYSMAGGKTYQIFNNLMKVSHIKTPTLETFKAA